MFIIDRTLSLPLSRQIKWFFVVDAVHSLGAEVQEPDLGNICPPLTLGASSIIGKKGERQTKTPYIKKNPTTVAISQVILSGYSIHASRPIQLQSIFTPSASVHLSPRWQRARHK